MNFDDFKNWTVFKVFLKTIHPFFGLFTYYDYRMDRFTRFTFVLGQVSLITIIVYLTVSHTGNKIFDEELDERTFKTSTLTALVISALTLPLPYSATRCLHSEIYVCKDEEIMRKET